MKGTVRSSLARCVGALIVAALLGPLSAHASEDLLFHYQRALSGDPRLRAAEAGKLASYERRAQAVAGFFPTIAATASRNRNEEKIETDETIFSRPTGRAEYSSSEYRLTLSQPIIDYSLVAGLDVADADTRRAEAELAANRQELAVRVAQAYLDVLLAHESLALAQAERSAIAHQRASVEARKRAGAATLIDFNDVLARFQTAAAQETEAQNELADKREALQEITGQPVGELAALDENMPLVLPEPRDKQRWVDAAVGQNALLRAAKAAAETARENITVSRSGHAPTLSFVGNRSYYDADATIPGPGVRSNTLVYGLQLNLPIFQGGLINARTEEAAYRYEAAAQELEARRRAVVRATRAAYQGVDGGKEKIEALEQAAVAASTNLAAKSEGYSAGVFTTLDVLDATRDVFRAKRDYAEARHAYVLNLLELKLAAGSLGEDDLVEINRWLRPAQN